MKILNYILIALLSLTIISGCKSTKKKGEISGLKKFYHNTTAYYNGYFNADEIIDESIFLMKSSYADNFTRLLPVYKYMANPSVKSFQPQLDTAIKKVSMVVALHRPSEWVDDCYMLAGKAQYLKQEYEDAEKTLNYLIAEFDPSDPQSLYWEYKKNPESSKKKSKKKKRKKKRKKKNRKNKKSSKESTNTVYSTEASGANANILQEKPAYEEGQYWLGRTLIERDKDSQAEYLLTRLHKKAEDGSKFKTDIAIALAHLYIETERYSMAIPFIEYGATNARDRQERARYAYITGQLYQMKSNSKMANQFFDKAESLSNSYEMIFNSKLNRIEASYRNKIASASKAMKSLEQMETDGKNTEYLDQVYFAMAKIQLLENNEDEALKLFNQSIKNGTGREFITAESYFELSQLYFSKDEFIASKLYLDSTLLFMTDTDDRYKDVVAQQENLSGIYEKLMEVNLKDSLLMISEMSYDDKLALASKLKKESKSLTPKSGKSKQPQGVQSMMNSLKGKPVAMGDPQSMQNKRKVKSSFFAYSDNAEKEIKKFKNRWGDRPLVDNWRVSSMIKGIDGQNDSPETGEESESQEEEITVTGAEMERIFADVPTSENEKFKMRSEIAIAMFDLGFLYREKLNRPDLTIEVLEELNEKYPGNQKELESFYNLYLAYKDLGRIEKAQEYADKIQKLYATSKFAMILRDPDYLSKQMTKEKELEDYYSNTLSAFHSENYNDVNDRIENVDKLFGHNNKYAAKFALIDAMNTGKLKGEEEYADKLRKLIARDGNTDEARRAKEILRFLNGDGSALTGNANSAVFKREDDKLHYVLATIENAKSVDMNKAKISVGDFNKKYYQLKNLNISVQYLDIKDNGAPIMIIRRFDNKDKAMSYYETIQQFKEEFLPKGTNFSLYAITQQNYREVLKERTLISYKSFFEEEYLKN